MGYYPRALVLECDKKLCAGTLEIPNTDQLNLTQLINIANHMGWLVPFGGGATLCPKCHTLLKTKYGHELYPEIKPGPRPGDDI